MRENKPYCPFFQWLEDGEFNNALVVVVEAKLSNLDKEMKEHSARVKKSIKSLVIFTRLLRVILVVGIFANLFILR